MRSYLTILICFCLLALLAPQPASADLESRVKKLEDELTIIKKTTQDILGKLESSFFENIPDKIRTSALSLYDTVVHHGNKGVHYVHKEHPKWIAAIEEYTKDIPTHVRTLSHTAQTEGVKHYATSHRFLTSFLHQQGVPQQYIQYITIGVIGLVLLTVAIITLTILSSLLALCCGRKKRSSNTTKTQQKKDKIAARQHQEHEQKIAKERAADQHKQTKQ